MIWVTGDIHNRLYLLEERLEKKNIKPGDTVIVAGDFGIPFYNESDYTGYTSDQRKLDQLAEKDITILYLDGNHENFPEIFKYPEVDYCGGRAHKLRENVFHLQRGYVFTIEGKYIFTMGGAASIDEGFRVPYESWWPEEIPTDEEYNRAIENLKRVEHNVDYIICHTAPETIIRKMGFSSLGVKDMELTGFLDWVMRGTSFKAFLFGHWHINGEFYFEDKYFRALNDDVVSI